MRFQILPIQKEHDRSTFACGHELLDNYLKRQARQDVSRDLSACFVLIGDNRVVYGYYTLSASSISSDVFPDNLKKKLPPSYHDLPTVLLGRLAIDERLQGQGFGAVLLMDALSRVARIATELGTLALLVDPIDDAAKAFYGRFGFIHLPGSGKMMLPMQTIQRLVYP